MQGDWTAGYVLRLSAFLAHFLSAIFIGFVTARCGDSFVTSSYAEVVSAQPVGYPLLTSAACEGRCFFGIPQAYLTPQKGLEWNVFALLAAFEWVSASFSLFQLRPNEGSPYYVMIAGAWNLAGALLLMPYTTRISTLQVGITWIALLVATIVQVVPIVCGFLPGRVVMHYTEYCTSASLLFLAVLILFVPSPPSWAGLVGFTGILLCNLCGIGAHLCMLEPHDPDNLPGKSEFNEGMELDWVGTRNRFGLFLMHSWLGLLMGVLVIIYLARNWLGDPIVPWWVRLILYNLLVTYSLFGVWATACYVVSAFRKGEAQAWWVSECLGNGLVVLSAAAKLPVVYSVFFGLVAEPTGRKLCSVF